MEVAASLRQLGLTVTLIHRGHGLFDQLGSPELSDQLLALHREHRVDVLLEEEVARFGGDTALEYVEAKSGLCVDFLEASGLALDNGVVVNQRFETTVPGVYAAGDVANFYDPLYARQRRIEHWSNANYQGTEVGRILAGRGGGYDTVSSFFSEVFGTTITCRATCSSRARSRARSQPTPLSASPRTRPSSPRPSRAAMPTTSKSRPQTATPRASSSRWRLRDVTTACDLLRPVWERTEGGDG
jgi:NADPH-dependent 2,4-dienoyl-CoA reductase/sulfur reductase-like enzyme